MATEIGHGREYEERKDFHENITDIIKALMPTIIKCGKLIDDETQTVCTLENFKLKNTELEYVGLNEACLEFPSWRAKLSYEFNGNPRNCNLIIKRILKKNETKWNKSYIVPIKHRAARKPQPKKFKSQFTLVPSEGEEEFLAELRKKNAAEKERKEKERQEKASAMLKEYQDARKVDDVIMKLISNDSQVESSDATLTESSNGINAPEKSPKFTNELVALEEIMPAFEKFSQLKLNICNLYYSISEYNKIIINDFVADGFRVAKQQYNLNLEHILAGVKYLAKFHSVGFAMRHKDPNQYEMLTAKLKEIPCRASEIRSHYRITLNEIVERMKTATKRFRPRVTTEFLDRLSNVISHVDFLDTLVEAQHPYITLCQGDFICDNIAFKYDSTDTEKRCPTDVMIYDFQTLRSGSPMLDLTTFLALCTFTEVRGPNFELIFKSYVDELRAGFERSTKEKPPKYLEYKPLLEEYVKFSLYSLSLLMYDVIHITEVIPVLDDELLHKAKKRAWNMVYRELAFQVRELFEFYDKSGIDVFQGFEMFYNSENF